MRMLAKTWAILAVLSLALSASAHAVGGIYFDDVSVSNNGKVVFADNFNDGNIDGWKIARPDVRCIQTETKPINYCLYLNRLNDINTYASRLQTINNVGAFEVKAFVNLPPAKEQWGYRRGRRDTTRIDVMTARNQHWFYVAIQLEPKESACRLQLTYVKQPEKGPDGKITKSNSEDFRTQSPVVPLCAWAEIAFTLDPVKKKATVLLDGKPQVSCDYDPSQIKNVISVDLTTWMGDMAITATPSGNAM